MTDTPRRGDWMQTASGRRMYPYDPRPEDIDVRDIAHALSLICRFGGHCLSFYSVAEHSVRASRLVPHDDALWALLHDASEAYLGDICRPLKHGRAFDDYRRLERQWMLAIGDRFGLPLDQPESVAKADEIMLATERRDLMKPTGEDWHLTEAPMADEIHPWQSALAEMWFLEVFEECGGKL